MSDKYCGFTVALNTSMGAEDAHRLMDAIQMIKGVISVSGIIDNPEHWIHEQKVRHDLTMKLYKIVSGDNENEN